MIAVPASAGIFVSMIALGGPTLKLADYETSGLRDGVSMIALGGPTLKPGLSAADYPDESVSMIALGGPTLKLMLLSFSSST